MKNYSLKNKNIDNKNIIKILLIKIIVKNANFMIIFIIENMKK